MPDDIQYKVVLTLPPVTIRGRQRLIHLEKPGFHDADEAAEFGKLLQKLGLVIAWRVMYLLNGANPLWTLDSRVSYVPDELSKLTPYPARPGVRSKDDEHVGAWLAFFGGEVAQSSEVQRYLKDQERINARKP